MTVETEMPTATRSASTLGAARPPGARVDTAFRAVALGGGLLVLVVLALIAYATIREAWPAFRKEGLGFVLDDNWDPGRGAFGALAFVYGTLVVSSIALVVAVPMSVGIALFVTEVAPRWLRQPVVSFLDLLAAVPSVVFGLWAVLTLINDKNQTLTTLYRSIHSAVAGVPVVGDVLDGDPIRGAALMTAGLVLAVMIIPIVTSVIRETFATVPQSQKDAALALGATRWEMIRAAVFPHSRSGMVAGVLIGFGRAVGETIAVALVVGSNARVTEKLFSSGDALPSVIANQFGEATGTLRAALIGMGVVLFVVTFVIGIAARAIVARTERAPGGVV